MKHVIVTRFNLKWKFTKKKGYDQWLNSRIKLWEKYLIGSLKKQEKNEEFKYILAIDSDTDDHILNILKNTLESCNFKYEIYKFSSMKSFQKDILTRVNIQEPYIFSRVDSDDSVSSQYTNNIQEFFKDINNLKKIHDYKDLYYMDVIKNINVLADYRHPSMFVSMIIDGNTHPYSFNHVLFRAKGYEVVKNKYIDCACICHSENIANSHAGAFKRWRGRVIKTDISFWWIPKK